MPPARLGFLSRVDFIWREGRDCVGGGEVGGGNIATRGFGNSNYDNPLGETIITIIDGGSGV